MKLLDIIREQELEEMAYPSSFSIEDFKNITTFAGKRKYCELRLRKIASGSGRTVYQVDDEKVLKLAKNLKGIGQNQIESDWFIQDHYGNIVTKSFDSDENDYWVEMELARKVTPNEFKRIVGVPLNGENSIEYWLGSILKNDSYRYDSGITKEVRNFLDNESEFAYELHDFVGSYNMVLGDISRISSWGKVNRNGEEIVVLTDYGLTEGVYRKYYR